MTNSLFVIDANTSFGKRVDPDPRFSAAALGAELDGHQVACVLSYSQQGIHYNPVAGNAEALAVAQGDGRIIPVAVIDPRVGLPMLDEVTRCLQAGVRAFRLFPYEQGWSVSSALFLEVVGRLAGSGAVLLTSSGGWELPNAIARVTSGTGISVLLTDTSYFNMAEVLAVMRAYPHVYAETSWLATPDAIDIAVEEVGADRILYGSAAPACPMQKSLNQILEAAIPDAQKIAILGGNAMRLFGITPAQLAGRPMLDSLQPKRFAEEIIDVHSHLGYWFFPMRNADYDPSEMIARMRRCGITHTVASTYESMRYDVAAGNARLAHALEGHPELHGYVELTPHDLQLSCAEMDKYYALPNFAGCEIELTHIPCPTDDPKVHALLAEIAKRGKPVLFMPHAAGDAPIERQLGRENPNLSIIHAHGFDPDWARVVQDTPNICVEFNRSRPSHMDGRGCLDILGPERVLFGSDQTLLSPGAMIGLYMDMHLTAEERQLVLAGNARRIFGMG